MGVFKWLRRERVTVTTSQINPSEAEADEPTNGHIGTIRTEEYKRDLAEFQARRSAGYNELKETPNRKKCGRHSLPVSCTDCAGDPDKTFNYEKKSALKYKKKLHKRARSAQPDDKHDGVPNIQFLFQNQVFMPGNVFKTSFSEPRKRSQCRSPEFLTQKHIDFDDEQPVSPLFLKNNSLPFDVKNFLDSRSDEEEVDGFVDEKANSAESSRTDDTKSDASTFGLPIASSCNLNMTYDRNKKWCLGKWGVVPVQMKTLYGVTMEQVKKKRNMEINILRKCRHPNVILLMGLYPDVQNNVHIVCERTLDTLFSIIHEQGRVLSTQTAVHYALDITSALAFLMMQGYIHTDLNSASIMLTSHDTAKLADLSPCVKVPKIKMTEKDYDAYSPEPLYVNIEDTCKTRTADSEPLLSGRSLGPEGSALKEYKVYMHSARYGWHAPELFQPDDDGLVRPCSKSDVYSLCVVLWECCNAKIPWKGYSYEKLKETYTVWKTGIRLPQDGTYPGCLLALLQRGLTLSREERISLTDLQHTLQSVKNALNEMEYIIIPERLPKKRSDFSSQAWDSTTPSDSDCISPKNIEHDAVIHTRSSTESENKSGSPIYHTIRKTSLPEPYDRVDKCFISNEDLNERLLNKYDNLEKDYSSACSTPISKFRERIKDTPGTLHRSDSTEYCSILSPEARNFALNDNSIKDQSGERPTAKLSRSFTPKSYKPLHIKVPEFNLDSIRDILKDRNANESVSYNFDIKNYSLPSTPIARSTKLRKNAWLSGELSVKDTSSEILKVVCKENGTDHKLNEKPVLSEPASTMVVDKQVQRIESEFVGLQNGGSIGERSRQASESEDTVRDSYTGLKRIPDPPSDFPDPRGPAGSRGPYAVEQEVLASVNVKPLVAIHERWICEANKKTVRSMSLPEDRSSKSRVQAVKPASHCVDTMQKSLPQLYFKPSMAKPYRPPPASPAASWKSGSPWEQFFQTREMSKSFPPRDFEVGIRRDADKSTITDDIIDRQKIDQATDTRSIEEFIRELIRKEFQYLLQDSSDISEASSKKTDDLVNKGVANVLESLKDDSETKIPVKSFSTVKINGNNKPLLQITFSRSGENSLQVLDNCVNVTIAEGNGGKEKLNLSIDDTLTDEIHINALKRCQAFNAIQEAKSTEDLYIDDDISTHMQENFGGKLIPLHGSLHEILCEKKDECCLIKVKQENGCDTIYFKCDSDTESRDAIDGFDPKDTVVFKRSISVIEERIQRVHPKDKRPNPVAALRKLSDRLKSRPKSEIFVQNITKESRILSNSSPCLYSNDKDEVEVNIENVMCYQDSSSDECLKCQAENDDFEIIEREIEEGLASANFNPLSCGCLEKISEENLSVINEEEKN
ncbi:uncharacterized protein LOC119839576 isoform X2 [Zerene cesonia]|uniref:uncharacterized protein LOC119839576 isoform X1 n=1 Tax=Zerene cesonia TaxID=33412 RepID=UPI0018E4FEA7|nr:uncharacterized protein LOC119839576 isoform X1 [Zerene cesonia]XP_038221861.1 uncharacterized protein LOC119839576 isoform X2 [Zerene cesonia]